MLQLPAQPTTVAEAVAQKRIAYVGSQFAQTDLCRSPDEAAYFFTRSCLGPCPLSGVSGMSCTANVRF